MDDRSQSQTHSSGVPVPTRRPPRPAAGSPTLASYQCDGFFDELVDDGNMARPDTEMLVELINRMSLEELVRRQGGARLLLSVAACRCRLGWIITLTFRFSV